MGYRQSVLADLPWGYWQFGELSGSTAFDSSPNHRDATYVNNPTLGVTGPLTKEPATNYAVNFDPTSTAQYVQLPSATILTNASFSIEMLAYLADEAERTLFTARTATAQGQLLFLTYRSADRLLDFQIYGQGDAWTLLATPFSGAWHHVVATYDASTHVGSLYLDGVLIGSNVFNGFVGANPVTYVALPQSPMGAGPWKGRIAHVALYAYALSADQISRHYQEVLAPTTAISIFTPPFQSGAEYRLDLHTAAGVKVAEITDFLSIAYTRKVNDAGLLTFTLDGNHAAIPLLEDKSQVVVYRRNRAMGLDWTADFVGLWRGQERRYTDHDVFTARCPGILTMLDWRIVAWYAGTANRSDFQSIKSETVMKTLVSYNAGPNATTANGRVRNGTITGLTVETDQARGNTISYSCAWKSLLAALQDIAGIGGGDFDLVKTGAQTFEFRFYPGQRGTDRRSTLLFALDRGNMAEPVYTYDRTKEQTVAIIGGQGEGSDRQVVVRTGADYAATNDIEVFVDARNESTAAGLQAKGDARLYDARARPMFKFSILQTPACYYGIHYLLGDLVTARYRDLQTTQKIIGLSVQTDRDGAEKIDVETTLV